MTDDRLEHLAQQVADAIARQYNKRYQSKIPVPVPLEFDLELSMPKVAAAAKTATTLTPSGGFTISSQRILLNMTLYRDNVHEFLNTVIPHEMAHLKQQWDDVVNQATSIDHGRVWQIAMRAMNQVPKAVHTLDTSKAVAVYKAHKASRKKTKVVEPV